MPPGNTPPPSLGTRQVRSGAPQNLGLRPDACGWGSDGGGTRMAGIGAGLTRGGWGAGKAKPTWETQKLRETFQEIVAVLASGDAAQVAALEERHGIKVPDEEGAFSAEVAPGVVRQGGARAGGGGVELGGREEREDEASPCCVCSARDGPNQILCMMPGCGRSAHPRCVKERRKSTTWVCAVCARPKLLEGRRREKMGEIEAAGLKWIGGAILHDQRCAVACTAEPSRDGWYGAADLAAVATLAAQGSYMTHEDLALALKRAASIGQKAESEALWKRRHALGQPLQDYSTRAAALAGLLDTAEGWMYDLQKHLRTTGRALLREQRQEEIFAQASGEAPEPSAPRERGSEAGAKPPPGLRPSQGGADSPQATPPAALAGLSKGGLAAALEAELRDGLREALGPAWGLRAAEDATHCALVESRAALLRRLRPVAAAAAAAGPDAGGPAAVRAAVRRALAP